MTDTSYSDLIFISLDVHSSISGFISLVATSLLIVLGFYFRIYERRLGKMVLVVNTADFIYILLKLLGFIYKPTDDVYCRVTGAIAHAALMMSFTWVVFFAHTLYESVKQHNLQDFQTTQTDFKYYWIISTTICSILGFGVLLTDYVSYSDSLQTCVHRVYFREFDFTMGCLAIIPTFILCFLCITLCFLSAKNMKKLIPDIRKRDLLPLLLYPAIMIICFFPAMIANTMIIYQILPSTGLGIVLKNLIQLHGFFDVLAYGVPTLRTALNPRAELTENDKRSEITHAYSREVIISGGLTATSSVDSSVELSLKIQSL